MNGVLDTGQPALWNPDRRRQLDRCHSCERHPDTQGHHDYCPEKEC